MLKRINRARVDRLLAGLLERVKAINANNELCCFVNEIRLFGSAADTDAESFADVDICYVLARRKRPTRYNEWSDWNVARAEQSGSKNLQYFEMLFYGETEVRRTLKNRSPYLSLHDLDDIVSIGADSIRLYVAPEGAIEADDGRMSGKALSQAAMNDAKKNAATRGKKAKDKKTSMLTILDDPPRDRMVRAIKSLAFDLLRVIDEPAPVEALERSIEVAHECIQVYRRQGEAERVADIFYKALSIDAIEQEAARKSESFVFSGDRERWDCDGTSAKRAAEHGMKHAVIGQLKATISARRDSDFANGMTGHFEDYRRAEYDAWKYREEHGYDWYGPESLSERSVITLRRIADGTGEKLDQRAVETLRDRGFIKLFRKTKWQLTVKGDVAVEYHNERRTWAEARNKIGDDK
jgi:hypothetical protein